MNQTMAPAEARKPDHRSLPKRIGFRVVSVALGLLISVSVCEAVFRVLEYRESSKNLYEGEGGKWFADGRWGWRPSKGKFRVANSEFDVSGNINSLYMNDAEYDPNADEDCTRVLALGDSHTFATGVSTDQAWPKVLERKLNQVHGQGGFRIYNGGVTGFNLHQHLLRLTDQGPPLRPRFVILGLSYATDLYDLLPPEYGGWIYGANEWPRDYFGLDASGRLVERRWEGQTPVVPAQEEVATNPAASVRQILDNSAVFRYLRRSNLALTIGSRVRIKGQSLWPNMEVVLEKEPGAQHRYQWRLFESLLLRINEESAKQSATLVVVGIPYLPQVYDDIWDVTFGANPKYSRDAANNRVVLFCKSHGITYIETLMEFRNKNKASGRWLHHRKDAHPTPEGQELIADTILKAGVITPEREAVTAPPYLK